MNLKRTLCVLIPTAMVFSGPVFGAGDSGVNKADLDRIRKAFPELSEDSISTSPIPGLYQLMVGGQISYISSDGRYLFRGDILDIKDEVNLTEAQRMTAREVAIDKIGEDNMIIFRPKGEVKHTVTVFTDIDCGFCRKLHSHINDYNNKGIAVRYLFFPRSGPDTPSWHKAENVWCAKDRNTALTLAKTGVEIKSDDCGSTPVSESYHLGLAIGVRGTPAIVMQDGEMIPGYVSPDELLDYLEK